MLSFETTSEQEEMLDDLVKNAGCRNRQELLNNPLTVGGWIQKYAREGRIICAIDEQKQKMVELVMPWIQNLQRKSGRVTMPGEGYVIEKYGHLLNTQEAFVEGLRQEDLDLLNRVDQTIKEFSSNHSAIRVCNEKRIFWLFFVLTVVSWTSTLNPETGHLYLWQSIPGVVVSCISPIATIFSLFWWDLCPHGEARCGLD